MPGSKPIDCKVYPLNLDEQKALDEFLEENLKSGRIRPSNSPMASPFFFVKKKDGALRPVQDYRKLNEMTIKNHYPLPLIQELIDKLKLSKVFSKMDIRWGYNNIRIKFTGYVSGIYESYITRSHQCWTCNSLYG